jgi:N-glycosylase/DNA lyase
MENQLRLFKQDRCIVETNTVQFIDETSSWERVKHLIHLFPDENDELLPGVKWGNYTQLYTPAFWKFQYLLSDHSNESNSHQLASTIVEEIIMCILGGYGIPSEMGIIAFNRLKENNVIKEWAAFNDIYEVLANPLILKNGKQVRYRFYNQKSKYIHKLLNRKDLQTIPLNNDIDLRNWLLTIDGIGLKTASWITRNWLKSDNVAILDIHLLRAGKLAGFFDIDISYSFNYLLLEKKYLEFCEALQVHASNMDAIIWYYMKKNTKLAVKTIFS